MPPRVDVVVAVHHVERPIARAVGSVLRGSGDDVRVIVVCHDLPAEVIAGALGGLADDERVRLVEHRDGIRSPSGPFNAGLDASEAEWVSIMGSDDELERGAVEHWLRGAHRCDARIVLPRIVRLGQDGSRTVVATPPARPGGRRRLDGVRDRLAYRSAPLGLLHRDLLHGLRFGGGMPQGGDVLFSSRLWFSGAAIAAVGGPAYLVHDDARDRVTLQPRPIAVTLSFVDEVVHDIRMRALPADARLALAAKLLRINVMGEFVNRPREAQWPDEERDALDTVVRSIRDFAPEVLEVFPRVDRALLDALPAASGVSAAQLLRLARSRRAFATPRALLPRSLGRSLHREAPLRFIVGSLAARQR